MSQTITPELQRWIAEQAAAGQSRAALLDSMLAAGWDTAVSQAALAQALDGAAGATRATSAGARRLPQPDLSGAPLYIDVGDRQVAVLVSVSQPQLVVFGNLLSDAECDELIAAARPRMARSLTVAASTGGDEVNEDRTSSGMFFMRGETDVVARLEARIARLVNWPESFGEGLQILRYGVGAEYKPHHDYFDPAEAGTPRLLARGGQRLATLVIYLSEPTRGGATTFPEVPLEVAPKRGNAVFFAYPQATPASRTLHGGAPVGEGEKWIATKWLREHEFA